MVETRRMTFIILRYMRRPIMVLIGVYAISMVGWIVIPGVDAAGNPRYLSFFHAFYFLTYTVTTTGFGELPHAFTEAQRMWGIVSLYAGVIAWFYALGSIVGLVQNPDFQRSVAERRFARRVARITDPFCIVCGYGNTGALLTRGLTDGGLTVVVIDWNEERIKKVTLRDYRSEVVALCEDARVPEHLIEAGLRKRSCKAVVALTQNEEVNLKIAVSARLLNPEVWVATQSTSEEHEATLSTLGENIHIVDPFQTYAKYLGAIIRDPAVHCLNQWLAGTPGAGLKITVKPPRGTWVLCGFGRMGRWIRDSLSAHGIKTIVIEPDADGPAEGAAEFIVGRATQKNLQRAGAAEVAGIVAGTDNDSENLGILLDARALNPNIFTVVRQNRYRNQIVFEAANADLIMMPSLVSARRILFLLTAPLLKTFFETLRERSRVEGSGVIEEVIGQLDEVVGGNQPRLWTVDIGKSSTPAVAKLTREGDAVLLRHLVCDAQDRERNIACMPLVLRSGERTRVLPDLELPVRVGDQVLFCATQAAYRAIGVTLGNEYTLRYIITGLDEPRGWIMKWLTAKLIAPGRPAPDPTGSPS